MFPLRVYGQSSYIRVYRVNGVCHRTTYRHNAPEQLPEKDPLVSSKNLLNQTIIRRLAKKTQLHPLMHHHANQMPHQTQPRQIHPNQTNGL